MPDDRFGPFRLDGLIRDHGLVQTWRAYNNRSGRDVQLKRLPSWLKDDAEAKQRFADSARAAVRLNGSHILPVLDFGEVDGEFYVETPPFRSVDLASVINGGPLSLDLAADVTSQLADAIYDVDRAENLHPDLDPRAILVVGATESSAGTVYISDFDLYTSSAPSGEQVLGNPAYSAPECYLGRRDHVSDVYALSCLLFEMLVGSPPFEVRNVLALRAAHERAPVPRPSRVRGDVPMAIDDVIARGMAKDPTQRYATSLDLASAVRAALVGRTWPADAPPGPARLSPDRPGGIARGRPRRPRRTSIRGLAVVASAVLVASTAAADDGVTPAPVLLAPAQDTAIPVGVGPSSLALSADGGTLYVANRSSDTISVIDTRTRAVRSTMPVKGPQSLALSPDGATLVVGSYTGLFEIDTSNGAVRTLPLTKGQAERVALSPDGSKIYVATYDGDSVNVYATATGANAVKLGA